MTITVPVRIYTRKFRPKFGALGAGVGSSSGNQATTSIGDASKGASIGATVGSVVPGVGTAIGAAVGAVVGVVGSLFGPAKEGQAAQTWDDMVQHGYLFNTQGTAFDERYFGEALKGAMDKGNNVWPGCGSDGYKNPDCFYSELADTIVNGYTSGTVPLTASVNQVYTNVVVPWLKSGAGGLFNWNNFNAEATQNQALLIQAAVDRYVNGLPITRANMPAYASQAASYKQWSTPSISAALAPYIAQQQAAATAAANAKAAAAAAAATAAANAAAATAAANAAAKATATQLPATPVTTATTTPEPTGTVTTAVNPATNTATTVPATTPTTAATSATTLPAGYGYNYGGAVVPVPSGYTLASNGYIMDAQGYIFGSANDDALTTATTSTTSMQQPTEQSSYSEPIPSYTASATPQTVPVAAQPVAATSSNDDTLIYVAIVAIGIYLIMNKKK